MIVLFKAYLHRPNMWSNFLIGYCVILQWFVNLINCLLRLRYFVLWVLFIAYFQSNLIFADFQRCLIAWKRVFCFWTLCNQSICCCGFAFGTTKIFLLNALICYFTRFTSFKTYSTLLSIKKHWEIQCVEELIRVWGLFLYHKKCCGRKRVSMFFLHEKT